jgi:hypothetical protein
MYLKADMAILGFFRSISEASTCRLVSDPFRRFAVNVSYSAGEARKIDSRNKGDWRISRLWLSHGRMGHLKINLSKHSYITLSVMFIVIGWLIKKARDIHPSC